METLKTKKQQSIEDLTKFADLLKANGFTVIVSKKHSFEWLYFEKNNKIGTVSPDGFYNFNFGSVHKPCKECGTGFRIATKTELTLKAANDTLIDGCPHWASKTDREAVRKYKDVQEFITHSNNKWAEYYIY